MLVITLEVDAPAGMEFAVKEDLAMVIEERYGKTTRVISVKAIEEQLNEKKKGGGGIVY